MLGAQRQAGENVDRSGQHWTPVALWNVCSMHAQFHIKRETETSVAEKGIVMLQRKETVAVSATW